MAVAGDAEMSAAAKTGSGHVQDISRSSDALAVFPDLLGCYAVEVGLFGLDPLHARLTIERAGSTERERWGCVDPVDRLEDLRV